MLPPATRLVVPVELVTSAPSVMSLPTPPALSNRLPIALIAPPACVAMPPATVVNTRLPALVRFLCAASTRLEPVTVPSVNTWLTMILAVSPTTTAVDSVTKTPPLPTLVLSFATSVSMWLSATPTLLKPEAAFKRRSRAYTSTDVSALSRILPPVLRILTSPQIVWLTTPRCVRSAP